MSPPRATATNRKPHGQIRQSQIVTTFGPGAMVDLPDHAVIIGGLEHWVGWRDHPIHEERLAAKVRALLELPSIEFYAPPPDPDDPMAPRTGVTAWLFPEWFIAQYEINNVRAAPDTRGRSLQGHLMDAWHLMALSESVLFTGRANVPKCDADPMELSQ